MASRHCRLSQPAPRGWRWLWHVQQWWWRRWRHGVSESEQGPWIRPASWLPLSSPWAPHHYAGLWLWDKGPSSQGQEAVWEVSDTDSIEREGMEEEVSCVYAETVKCGHWMWNVYMREAVMRFVLLVWRVTVVGCELKWCGKVYKKEEVTLSFVLVCILEGFYRPLFKCFYPPQMIFYLIWCHQVSLKLLGTLFIPIFAVALYRC